MCFAAAFSKSNKANTARDMPLRTCISSEFHVISVLQYSDSIELMGIARISVPQVDLSLSEVEMIRRGLEDFTFDPNEHVEMPIPDDFSQKLQVTEENPPIASYFLQILNFQVYFQVTSKGIGYLKRIVGEIYQDRVDIRSPLVITASAFCPFHENPFVIVASTRGNVHFLHQYELTSGTATPSLSYSIQSAATFLAFYSADYLLVGHERGYSILQFTANYNAYSVIASVSCELDTTAITCCVRTPNGQYAIGYDGKLTLRPQGEGEAVDLEGGQDKVVSLVFCPVLMRVLFALTVNSDLRYSIKTWDIDTKEMLYNVDFTCLSPLKWLFLQPCVKTTGRVVVLVLGSTTIRRWEYFPLITAMKQGKSIKAREGYKGIVDFYTKNDNVNRPDYGQNHYFKSSKCLLLYDSNVVSLPTDKSLPSESHPMWTAPLLAADDDQAERDLRLHRTLLQDQSNRLGLKDMIKELVKAAAEGKNRPKTPQTGLLEPALEVFPNA